MFQSSILSKSWNQKFRQHSRYSKYQSDRFFFPFSFVFFLFFDVHLIMYELYSEKYYKREKEIKEEKNQNIKH